VTHLCFTISLVDETVFSERLSQSQINNTFQYLKEYQNQ